MFYGDSRAADWPAPALPQFEFVNRGMPGENSTQAVSRFDTYVKPQPPQVLVLQLGINDLTAIPLFPTRRENIIAICRANIRQIITGAVELEATVVLTTIFPVGHLHSGYQEFDLSDIRPDVTAVNRYLHTLAGPNVLIFDTYHVLADENHLKAAYALDLLHLNPAGYAALNRALIPILQGLRLVL